MKKVLGKLKNLFITGAIILSFVVLLVPASATSGLVLIERTQAEYATLQDAVTAASEGDTLVLKAGVYDVDKNISISKSLTIKGEGSKVTIIQASDSFAPGYMFTFGGTDKAFYLEGLSIIGKVDNSGCGIKIGSTTKVDTVSIKDCRFEKLNYGIYNGDNFSGTGYTRTVKIENSYFSCGLVGPYFERVKNVEMKNNTFVQSSRAGFQIYAPLTTDNIIESISITGNKFDRIGSFAFILDILGTTNLQKLTIQNNISTNIGGDFARLQTYRYRVSNEAILPTNPTISNNGDLKATYALSTSAGNIYQPVIEATKLADGTEQLPYQQSIKVDSITNGTVEYALKEGTMLPEGLVLDKSGNISGTPTKAGTYTFVVKATNEAGSDEKEMSITVAGAIPVEIPTIDTDKDIENIEVGINDEVSKEKLTNFVSDIIKDVIQDNSITSLDLETIKAIQKALEENHIIDSKVNIEKITEKDIDVSDKTIIEETLLQLTEDKGMIEQYFDLSVQLWANQNKLGNVTQLPECIKFTMALPKELLIEERDYFVLRMHEGEVERLEVLLDENGILTFETDRFSTYVLAYTEKTTNVGKEDDKDDKEIIEDIEKEEKSPVEKEKNTDNGKTSVPKKSTNSQKDKATTPMTSDDSQIILYVAYGFVSLMILMVYTVKKEVSRK